MKVARYLFNDVTSYGVVERNVIKQIEGTPFEGIKFSGNIHPMSEVKLMAPVVPTKILALALNYKSHIRGAPRPTNPEPFLKTPSCIIGPEDPIVLPRVVGRVDEEAELVVVIRRKCSKVTKAQAMDYVLGYTCGNDVSARDWQKGDVQWWRAKSSDTFGPIGPYIVTNIDASRLNIWGRVNGKAVQHCNTSELLFDIPTLTSFISQVVCLEPGDLIFTGTSGIPAEIKKGDIVEVEIESIGVLSNPVQKESASLSSS